MSAETQYLLHSYKEHSVPYGSLTAAGPGSHHNVAMDAAPTTAERARELAALRARAYGPGADIHSDAEAIARLRELEDLARADAAGASSAGAEAAEPGIEPGTRAAAASGPGPGGVPGDPVGPGGTPAVPASRPPRWRRVSTWAPIVVAAALGLAVGLVLPGLLSPQPDAVLRTIPIEGAPVDLAMFGVQRDSAIQYAPYRGLQVWSGETAAGSICVFVGKNQEQWLAVGCAPGQLDPTADVGFHPGIRELTGLDLSDESTMRFVLRGDAVEVWVAPTEEAA